MSSLPYKEGPAYHSITPVHDETCD